MGYDDVPLAARHCIQLTTARSDAVEMGERAAQLVLTAAREGRQVAHREVQRNPLIVRSTTGRP
jgi:DNA-binding LacI/PurR family transcriptional regulator